MRTFIRAALAVLVISGATLSATAAGIVIGSFDTTRAGAFSPAAGASMTGFRTNIAAAFPSATFMSTNVLTSSFLGSINLLVLTVVLNGSTPITPLSAAEQTALTDFVQAGGGAVVFTDNNIQFEAASQSEVQPFGLDSTGSLPNAVAATITSPTHPVANGPFGAVSNFTIASFPGWYDSLGAHAIAIATLNPNSQVCLAAIYPGLLSPNSGGVVFFSDTTIFDGGYSNSLPTLVDNAIQFALTPPVRPILSIIETNNASVVVSWDKSITGFHLQSTTNLAAKAWSDQALTGPNAALLAISNSATFFRLITPP